jgi:hypothetical protein
MKRLKAGPEIAFTFVPRIAPGEYPAYCTRAEIYRDRQFRRWVFAAQFDILDDSLVNTVAQFTWYLNLGSGERPRAGRRGFFWAAWVKANGGPPRRPDRMSHRIFERHQAIVIIADTAKTHNSDVIAAEESYSVVRDVLTAPPGGFWVKLQVAGVVGHATESSKAQAITFAVARAIGIEVDR